MEKRGSEKRVISREKFIATMMRKKREERMKKVYDSCFAKISKIPRDAFFVAGLMLYLGGQ